MAEGRNKHEVVRKVGAGRTPPKSQRASDSQAYALESAPSPVLIRLGSGIINSSCKRKGFRRGGFARVRNERNKERRTLSRAHLLCFDPHRSLCVQGALGTRVEHSVMCSRRLIVICNHAAPQGRAREQHCPAAPKQNAKTRPKAAPPGAVQERRDTRRDSHLRIEVISSRAGRGALRKTHKSAGEVNGSAQR